ncbi:Peptidoglycan-associated lipoprotein [Dyadobacter sp. CECT 9275]|uniref:Peptidoglycan-associated lipoprotein n=1 Tax=Dyadobacter helix TaxID=2822344 RepID=A0A916NDS7_9BACT|nr:OmpA family protein [Dyadobacter sp. CECT 9275]CAG5012825.1 Peptidoglycan-associated lipoprotein [Dyadobacter sp. CECT 9275]
MSNNNTLWWAALVAWMAGATWWHVCKVKLLCDAPMVSANPAPTETFEVVPLHIKDGTSLDLHSPGNFGFAKSGFEANVSAVKVQIDSLSAYLKANPNKKVTITGYYSSEETNATSWLNLGIARAEGIKRYFVANGLPADAFTTVSELQDGIQFSMDSLKGGIGFAIADLAGVTEKTLAEGQKYESIFKPLDIYFSTGSSEYIRTSDNAKFIQEAKQFLAEHRDKKLLLTGHTDNVGNEAANALLSGKRADYVKRQLIAAGLPESQLSTDAKGQNAPRESNDTKEGRAANRRVTIVVQ